MSQNSQDAIDVLSKVIVDTIEKKLNDAKFDKSQTGVVTAVSGNTYTISVFGSQYNITSDQIYTVGQSVVVTALQGDMKRLVCSPDNIGTMKTVDSKVNVVGSQLSIIDTDFADTIVKYTDVSEFLTLKDQVDGQLSLWFYSGVPSTDTAPTVNWVTEDLALLKSRSKRLYCRIELLNKDYQIIDTIEGLALSGSNSIDADSDTRRTFNLDIFPKSGFSISQFSTEEWTSKMLRLQIGMKAPTSMPLVGADAVRIPEEEIDAKIKNSAIYKEKDTELRQAKWRYKVGGYEQYGNIENVRFSF